MTEADRKRAAKAFSDCWKDKGYEKGESQPFWLSLLRDIIGVEHPEQLISYMKIRFILTRLTDSLTVRFRQHMF